MDSHAAGFQRDMDLPLNMMPAMDVRNNLKTRLQEQNLAPTRDGFVVVATITRANNVANTISYQVVDGAAKPSVVFDARGVFRDAGEGHSMSLRKDFLAVHVNYSSWARSSDLQAGFWRPWKGTIK